MLPPDVRFLNLRLKSTKFDFGWGSAPDPAGELTALPQIPYLDLRGSTSKGRERRGRKGRGGRREGSVGMWPPPMKISAYAPSC